MSLNAKDVGEILKALEASSFDYLDLEIDGVKLSLRRAGAPQPEARTGSLAVAAPTAQAPDNQAVPAPAALQAADRAGTAPLVEVPPGTHAVPAPLLGVFYRAPRPGEPPFVEVGDRVAEDTIIGIIEVMKLMNTVRAGLCGKIVAIPARNGELVEYGEALLFVRPD